MERRHQCSEKPSKSDNNRVACRAHAVRLTLDSLSFMFQHQMSCKAFTKRFSGEQVLGMDLNRKFGTLPTNCHLSRWMCSTIPPHKWLQRFCSRDGVCQGRLVSSNPSRPAAQSLLLDCKMRLCQRATTGGTLAGNSNSAARKKQPASGLKEPIPDGKTSAFPVPGLHAPHAKPDFPDAGIPAPIEFGTGTLAVAVGLE